MELGEKLKGIRKNLRDYTLQKVFEETGISVSFLSDMERGKTKPSLETLQKLANFYQVNLSDLLEDSQDNKMENRDLYPPGLRELMTEDPNLDPEVVEVMLTMERRAKRKPETKDQWREYYYSLKFMMGR
ncbi:MAG: transcriptional regulator [Anaerolinea sp.]|jgi:XRE family transcriptional regulator, regulator of sulfur utilization|nr:transcriptional regulator [Anaerolinea sp.]PKO21666.1 MAG: transcriptional regulator [Chloroflexi bacterium HGW-Chloroflexi-1]